MKIKNIIFVVFFMFFFIGVAKAQVGGISASKLATVCTDPVPHKAIEFEPMFGFSYSNQIWDTNGKLHPMFNTIDSTLVSSEFGFRFSYGAFKNIEIGVAAPADMGSLSWGVKYRLPLGKAYSCGLLAGFNLPLGNDILSKTNNSTFTPAVAAGIVMTYHIIDEKMCIDFDVQYQKFIKQLDEQHVGDIFLNSDVGYFISKNIQLVLGINYSQMEFEQELNNSSLLTLNTGVTIECAENFILVLNSPIDLAGINAYKSIGFGMALTIVID